MIDMSIYELLMNYYRKETQDERFEEKYKTIDMNRDKFTNLLEERGVSQEELCEDVMSNMSNEYKAHQFKKRFEIYFGKEKALTSYIMNEIVFKLIIVLLSLILTFPLLVTAYFREELISKSILTTMSIIFLVIAFQQTLAMSYRLIAILKYPNIYGILFGWKASKVMVSNTQLLLIKRKQQSKLGDYAPAYYDFKYEDHKFQFKHPQKLTLYNHNLQGATRYTLGTEEHCFVTLHNLIRQKRIDQFKEYNAEFDTAKQTVDKYDITI